MKHYFVHPNHEADLRSFVRRCDEDFENRTVAALKALHAESIPRLLGLTGPTCAGKTTAAKKITDMLKENGTRVHVISIDDFYYDKEYLHQRVANDPNVEIDYDSESTIDTALLESCTNDLLAGQKTQLPRFDFLSGKRVKGELVCPRVDDILLFEGIQILYPSVNAILNQNQTYRILFICPTSSIVIGENEFLPNEIRFCRRLVRDYLHRGTSPEFTAYLWQSVRENEEKNIFPYVSNCHATIDSTMPYEMGMLKPYLEPLLRQIPSSDAFYQKACELLESLQHVEPISADYRTQNSLYKEFI